MLQQPQQNTLVRLDRSHNTHIAAVRGRAPAAAWLMPSCLQAQPDVPVSLQIGNGTPVSLTPAIQAVSSMLASALQSAVASASSAAAASTNPVPSGSRQPAQQNRSTAAGTPSSSGTARGPTPPAALLTPPVTQQVLRALMHVISPLVNGQGAPGASPAAASVPQADRGTPAVAPPTAGGLGRATPSAVVGTASNAAATPSDNSRGGSGPAAPRPLGLSEPLSEMIGGSTGAEVGVAQQGAAEEDVSMLMRAGASSVGVSGPMAMPTQQPEARSTATATTSETAPLPTAASHPSASAETAAATPVGEEPSSKPAAAAAAPASAAASGSVGTRPNRGAVGLGSALPPREKGCKKSHPRSPVPVATHDEGAGSRQSSGRPGPSNPQQDNVKRARHGDTTRDAPSTSTAERSAVGTDAGTDAASTQAGGEEAEEIPRPSRGTGQAGSAGGLDAMLAQMFGGGGGAADDGGSAGLTLNSLVQVWPLAWLYASTAHVLCCPLPCNINITVAATLGCNS